MPETPDAPDLALSRRGLLRLVGVTTLGCGAAVLAGCSADDREALLGVDPRQVRLDDEDTVPPRPAVSDRELRRRAVVAAARACRDATTSLAGPLLAGRMGAGAPVEQAAPVHDAHLVLLGEGPGTGPGRSVRYLPAPAEVGGGPVLVPAARPAAVLGAGGTTAVAACLAERAADDAQVGLAVLHARIAAARAAQAAGVRSAGAADLVWPTTSVGADVVDALRTLLAEEHRARWSYGVVLAWVTDRAGDAEGARADHTRRTTSLQTLVRRLGGEPVAARATYPTDDEGVAVEGPVTAAALALRVEDAVAAASAVVLAAAVADGAPEWVDAAVTGLAEAERSRWSWGGPLATLPGG